jgi:uncharacterized membrane protein YfcA
MSLLQGFSPLYAVSGLVVGFIVGLTGVGGGSLMTPILVLLFGVHPATAVGTDLLYAGLTKALGTVFHGRHGSVDWRIVGLLASGSVPASVVTLYILRELGPQSSSTSAIISVSLGVALLITAASLVFRDRLIAMTRGASALPTLWQASLTVLTGLIVGVLVSISSVGAGALGVTALYFLYPRLPARMIIGSDIAHAVPLTLVAGAGHWALGSVNFAMLGSLLVGSLPGIVAGSLSAPRIPDHILRPILAAVLLLVGARLILA